MTQRTKAILLAGSLDFGRCPLASNQPAALWPMTSSPAIVELMKSLVAQGIVDITICYGGDPEAFRRAIRAVPQAQVDFVAETLPLGTGGCLRQVARQSDHDAFLVCQASIAVPPKLDSLLAEHERAGAALTVGCDPSTTQTARAAGVYLCAATVVENLSAEGYCDIKETLIPELLRVGKKVVVAKLPSPLGAFRDLPSYLAALGTHFTAGANGIKDLKRLSEGVYGAEGAEVAPTARIFGPVLLGTNATIEDHAVVFGPAVIGAGARVGSHALIENSALWERAEVGNRGVVVRSVLDFGGKVNADGGACEEVILGTVRNDVAKQASKRVSHSSSAHMKMRSTFVLGDLVAPWRSLPGWTIMLAFVLFFWCYWPTQVELWGVWMRSDEYSAGLLVPFLAGYVLWTRRDSLRSCPIEPSWWGIPCFLGSQALRFFGLYYMYGSAEKLSLVLGLVSLAMLLLGTKFILRTSSIWLFMFLLLPLPTRVQTAITLPLQDYATTSSVFLLEMFGYDVVREGHVIHLNDTTVAVAEACNGLRMLTAFLIIASWVVLLVRRSLLEKIFILLSALPIGLVCNTIRLTASAIAFTMLEGEQWEELFHDWGGMAMMPLALLLVVTELWFFRKVLLVENRPQRVGVSTSSSA